MKAWLWIANPALKWEDHSGVGRFEALRRYIHSRYVYWATPVLQPGVEVKIGHAAYIWRTRSPYDNRNGVVAFGEVVEAPRMYLPGQNENDFERPEQLKALGWDEAKATSQWKTGIRLQLPLFWDAPLVSRLFRPGALRGKTVVPLTKDQERCIIEAALNSDGIPENQDGGLG